MGSRNKGIAFSYVNTILNTVIGVFMSAFVLRMLGKTNYGVYQTMTSFITYLSLFELGTGTIMTRNISLCKKDGSEQKEIQSNVSTIWSITCILSLIIIAVSFLFYSSIDLIYVKSMSVSQRNYGKIIFIVAVIKLLFTFYSQTINGILIGFERYSIPSVVAFVTLIIRTVIVIGALIIRQSAVLIVTIDTIIAAVSFIYTFMYCIKKFKIRFVFKDFNKNIFLQMLPLSFAMLLQTVVNMANNNVDKFIIGVVMSPEAVAVYSVAMFIFATFSSLTTIPITMYMPHVAKEMNNGKRGKELSESLIQPCRLIVLIGGAILFGFITVGRNFILLIYGKEYLKAWSIAVIIMIPVFINITTGVLVNVLDILRKRHIRSICLAITALGNIALTIWWIKIFGMIGAALATAVCTIIGNVILMNIYYQKVIKLNIIYILANSYKGLLVSLFISCLVGGFFVKIISNVFISFLFGGVVFCLVFLVCIFLFKSNKAEKEYITNLLKKLINK